MMIDMRKTDQNQMKNPMKIGQKSDVFIINDSLTISIFLTRLVVDFFSFRCSFAPRFSNTGILKENFVEFFLIFCL